MRVVVVVVVVLALATRAGAAEPKALAATAKQAASEGRFCDALHLYSLTFASTNEAKYLYNAAEVAFAGGDRVKALQLYSEVLQRFPKFDLRAKVEERIGQLGRAIGDEGAGTSCPVGAPVCGNGIAESGEGCDDGNSIDGDGCDSGCQVTACGNGVVTAREECDDGNLADGDGCSSTCTKPGCGNGLVNPGEGCDDGNRISGDGCDENCTATTAKEPVTQPPTTQGALPWLVTGAVAGAVGAITGVIGFVPGISYLAGEGKLRDLESEFADADADEQRALVEEAAVAHDGQRANLAAYNDWGRFVGALGVGLTVAGAAVAVGGLLLSGESDAARKDGEE